MTTHIRTRNPLSADNKAKLFAILVFLSGLPAADIHENKRFDAMDFTSLDRVELSFKVEDAFNITLADEAIQVIHTIGELMVLIQAGLEINEDNNSNLHIAASA